MAENVGKLSDANKNILPEFQKFLIERKLASEACWSGYNVKAQKCKCEKLKKVNNFLQDINHKLIR